MRSALYTGLVHHRRFGTTPHALRYRMTMALLDLDEIDELHGTLKLFSRNAANLFSFRDRDHLPEDALAGATLRGTVEARLAEAGIDLDGGTIALLSLPRILGYAFNPLSVYFCHRRDGAPAAILYEVRNTFRQRHTYVIPVEQSAGAQGAIVHQGCDKVFYVSPFLDMDMRYAFRIELPGERIGVAVDGLREGKRIITASFAGTRRELTDASLLRTFLAHPLLSFAVVAGIHIEALKLWLKGVGLRARPAPPETPATIVRREI